MAMQDYYFARSAIQGLGRMLFLKVPQEADSPGGGLSLLGSVVQEVRHYFLGLGIFLSSEYPLPMHLSVPGKVIKFLDKHKADLEIPAAEKTTLVLDLAPPQRHITVKRGTQFVVGVDRFPGVPLSAGLDIDHSSMLETEVSLGTHTKLHYIPRDYLSRLYKYVKGDHEKVLDSGAIEDNNIVHSALIAKNFTVAFKSEREFGADFKAKLEAFKAIPGIDAEVKYSFKGTDTLVAHIKADKDYLVALAASEWHDLPVN